MKKVLNVTRLMKYGLLAASALLSGCTQSDWRTASREPAGIAPNPLDFKQAVIEFYAADAFGWRGWFAVHTWVAIKPHNADEYTVYEVLGWRVNRGQPHCTNTKQSHQIAIGMVRALRKCSLYGEKEPLC